MADNIVTFPGADFFRKVEAEIAELPDGRLKKGDGDGTSGEMEARVARLEKNMDVLAKDVADIRVDVGTLKENLRHLPTKPWMFTTLAGMLVSTSVIVGLIVRFLPHA